MARARQAFTLVELLVVIGIIGVLTSILLPVLGSARERANTVKCAANLGTLAKGWHMYQQSNRGVSCPARLPTYDTAGGKSSYGMGDKEQYRPRWYELLGAQFKLYASENPKKQEDDSWPIRNDAFLCPSIPEWNNSRNYPYGYNYQFLGNARPKDGTDFAQKIWINYPVAAGKIKANTVMAMDSMGTAAGQPTRFRQGYVENGEKNPFAVGNKGWAIDPPRLETKSDYADPELRNPGNRSGPDPRHQKRVNVAFVDGHVSLMTLEELGYDQSPDGSMGINAPAHNRLFSGSGMDDPPPPVQ